MLNAHFTLADLTPRMASDVVGGKSGRNHPTSRRDAIHIGQKVCIGWYSEGVLFIATLSLKDMQLHCTCSAPDQPTTFRWSGTHLHWPSRQHQGTIGASDWQM